MNVNAMKRMESACAQPIPKRNQTDGSGSMNEVDALAGLTTYARVQNK